MTIQEVLNLGNPGLGWVEAVGRKLAFGDTLAALEETKTVASNVATLSKPALVIETVWNDTDNTTVTLVPAGETPAANQAAIGTDRKTLTTHAGLDTKNLKVRYLPLAVLATAELTP